MGEEKALGGRKAFAYQAAQYSMFAPLVAMGLGLVLTSAFEGKGASEFMGPDVRMGFALLNFLIILSAGVMGIVALSSVRRLGRRGLLVQGSIGVLLCLLLALIIGSAFLRGPVTGQVAKRMEGQWKGSPGTSYEHAQLNLGPNARATFRVVDVAQPWAVDGVWRVARQSDDTAPMMLQILFDKPPAAAPKIKGMLWEIEHVEAHRLDLRTHDTDGHQAEEIFIR